MSREIKQVGNKFIGMVNGQAVVKSASMYYVQRKMNEYGEQTNDSASAIPQEDRFGINERFNFVSKLVKMVAKGTTPSTIITGEGGLGKTFTVRQALEDAGLTDVTSMEVGEEVLVGKSYRMVKGFSTAKGLYRTLAENRNGVIVFDDCDSILKDPNATNILKGALDSFDKRVISWNTSRDDDDIPRSFEFKGGIIFISNMQLDRIEQALRSRSMCVDLSMTNEQKIQRMTIIARSPDFLPDVQLEHKFQALALIDQLKSSAKEVSLRTLIKATKIAASSGAEWKDLATYMLIQG